MEPFKLELPPGLFRQSTEYSQAARWNDGNLIRFFGQQLRPIKGWATGLTGTLTGNPRAAHSWKDNDGDSFACFATHSKLYAHDGTTLDDITPTSGFTAGDANTSTWTIDNFGELLIANLDEDGDIWEWQPGGGGDATKITNSPSADAIFVTEERFIVALGAAGDPRNVAWCDQENRTTWTATSTNQAGDLNLQSKGVAMCGGKVRGGALIWTDEDLHLMRYIGQPDIYGIERVAANCGIIGRHAHMEVDSVAYWMGKNGFWTYAGYVEPMNCEVSDDVFTNLNQTYKDKVWCLHNAEFSEVWWFYPRGAATECSNYVIFNYREGHWNHGTLARLCGFEAGAFDWPVMCNSSGAMLKHEFGWDYDSADRYLISGPLEIGSGGRRLQIEEIIPDESTQGDCEVYFYTRAYPNATESTLGPYNASDRIGVMTTARQARIEIRSESATEDFRIGDYRAIVKARGRY